MTGAIKQRRQGTEEAKKAADEARPRYDRPEFLTLPNPDDSIVIRPIDNGNEWWFVNQHSFVSTRGPAAEWSDRAKEFYPDKKGAVCRNDEIFVDPESGERAYPDCYICDHKKGPKGRPLRPSQRKWMRAVVRKPVLGTQAMVDAEDIKAHRIGKIIGYTDEIIEVETIDRETGKPTGNKVKKPRIVFVNFGDKNFFNALTGYYKSNDKNICDRDYRVVRDGKDLDTNYIITEAGHTPDFDLDDPDIKAKYLAVAFTIEEIIEDQSSDWYYETYFDERVPHPARRFVEDDDEKPDKADRGGAPASQQGKPAETKVNQSALDEMAARIEGRNQPVG